ncbi:hypothetical protein DFH08DRAFT_347295 [Mycena albidolilacea]|uniref:Uncharacterized protein n=1 Tax=Mycena albidolilacea TaxID=1033008 RepID=A0AAD7EH65_9AGAR|nr:hypothetical protein DFH08DRAFT_347295 [Mycena albidolilacea]
MSWLTVLPEDRFTTRLCDEIALCRSLLDQFHTKIKAYESFVSRIWMVASEEKELAPWRYQISECRAALHDLLGPISILQLHDTGEQLRRVGSQVQYVGSRIDNVHTEVRALGVLIENYLSNGITHMESEIRGVAADVQTVQQAVHKTLPRNISDPFFYVRNPLGERIPIPLSAYHIFDDLDRILGAYCHRPETGSRYVERGD